MRPIRRRHYRVDPPPHLSERFHGALFHRRTWAWIHIDNVEWQLRSQVQRSARGPAADEVTR